MWFYFSVKIAKFLRKQKERRIRHPSGKTQVGILFIYFFIISETVPVERVETFREISREILRGEKE